VRNYGKLSGKNRVGNKPRSLVTRRSDSSRFSNPHGGDNGEGIDVCDPHGRGLTPEGVRLEICFSDTPTSSERIANYGEAVRVKTSGDGGELCHGDRLDAQGAYLPASFSS
jgi:hypothetical protein